MGMAFDTDAIKSAIKFILSRENKVCRLCIGSTEPEEISIHDFLTVNTPYYNDKITYLSIFQELGLSTEPSLPEVLCLSCATLAGNSFIFKKICEYSQQQWESTIRSLDKIISQSKPLTPKTVSAYMIVGENENTMLTHKTPVDETNKVATLKIMKRNMKRRLKYVKVKQRKSRKSSRKEETKNETFSCPYCNKILLAKQSLDGHIERLHYQKKIKCDSCSEMFSTDKQLKIHRSIRHVTVICKLCGLKFPSRKKMYSHKNSHSAVMSKKRHTCPRCEKQIKSSSFFQRHLNICGQITKFICDICSKVYTNKASLKGHMITEHNFGVAVSCRWCNKKFPNLSALKDHEVKHTRERNFTCEICGGKFVTIRALIYHRRLHTGEKPYPCDLCDEHFLSSSRRMMHKRKVHLGPNKHCDVCPAKFFTKIELTRHRKYHDNPRSKLYVANINLKSGLTKGKSKVIVNYNED